MATTARTDPARPAPAKLTHPRPRGGGLSLFQGMPTTLRPHADKREERLWTRRLCACPITIVMRLHRLEHMHKYAAEYLRYAQRDRRRADNTISRYTTVLNAVEALGIDLMRADVEDIQRWWDSRLDAEPATRANELACLRSFYKWATKFDHRPDDPTRRLDAPKVPIRAPRPIGRNDLERLLELAAQDSPELARALALGAYAGLRVSEAASLDWSDVDQESRRIYVTGKGDKQRIVGLSPVLLDLLLPDTAGNVVTAGGQTYAASTLQRKVNRFMARHDVAHTSHDLRKRGATLALNKGCSIHEVAAMFGWANIETVKHYAAVSDEALDRIAAAMV
jgi:integrase/recombinase XerD